MKRLSPQSRALKPINSSLQVYGWTPGGFVRAGELALEEHSPNLLSASFAYATYPLDPLNLPRSKAQWATQSPFVRLGAIFDTAPDAWGRKVVQFDLQKRRGETSGTLKSAFLSGADGTGALVLTAEQQTEQGIESIVQQSLEERPTCQDRSQNTIGQTTTTR
jgi:serine/threonine-protein kinase HipA